MILVAEFIGAEMENTSNSDVRETEIIRVLSKVVFLNYCYSTYILTINFVVALFNIRTSQTTRSKSS